jgi:hypothetical protein
VPVRIDTRPPAGKATIRVVLPGGTAFSRDHPTQGCVSAALDPGALARAGLPRRRFLDLGDAYAKLMLGAAEELAVASRSLGHNSLSATADVYARLTRGASPGASFVLRSVVEGDHGRKQRRPGGNGD